MFNNSAESEITFTVMPNDNLVVNDFNNYPNLFFSTEFYFQYNQVDQQLDYI